MNRAQQILKLYEEEMVGWFVVEQGAVTDGPYPSRGQAVSSANSLGLKTGEFEILYGKTDDSGYFKPLEKK